MSLDGHAYETPRLSKTATPTRPMTLNECAGFGGWEDTDRLPRQVEYDDRCHVYVATVCHLTTGLRCGQTLMGIVQSSCIIQCATPIKLRERGEWKDWRLRFSSDADNVRLTNVCIIIIIIIIIVLPEPNGPTGRCLLCPSARHQLTLTDPRAMCINSLLSLVFTVPIQVDSYRLSFKLGG